MEKKVGTPATDEQKSILERVVVNAMRVASHEETGQQVKGLLSSGQSQGEGFSSAMTYLLKTVVTGLIAKGVDVTPAVLMSENGGASQIGQLLVAMIEAQGGDISMNEIQKGLEVSLHNFGQMMKKDDGARKQALKQARQERKQAEQAALQQQQPQQPQAQPQGMLAGAQQNRGI